MNKTLKTPLKDLKDALNKWEDIARSWIGRFNIIKMLNISNLNLNIIFKNIFN